MNDSKSHLADAFRATYATPTACELNVKMGAWRARHEKIVDLWRNESNKLTEHFCLSLLGREVSAKRARLLRRRGESVRYHGRTSTGKTRYTWMPKIKYFSFSVPVK